MKRQFVAKEINPLVETLADDLAKVNSEKLKLQKALEYYANYDNYSIQTAHNGYSVEIDKGEIARKALDV